MNYEYPEQFSYAEHPANAEQTVLFSSGEQGAASHQFPYANTGRVSEPTQIIRWQLPDERRLRVVRGGLRRDWRGGAQMLSGLLLIGLLMLTLAHWPVHGRPPITPHSDVIAASAALSASSSLPVPYAATNGRRVEAFSACCSGFSHYPGVNVYRHLRPPVPGLPDASVSPSGRPGRANALPNGYYAVAPAAPVGIGLAVPHYSY